MVYKRGMAHLPADAMASVGGSEATSWVSRECSLGGFTPRHSAVQRGPMAGLRPHLKTVRGGGLTPRLRAATIDLICTAPPLQPSALEVLSASSNCQQSMHQGVERET